MLWRGFEKATKAISPRADTPAMAEALAPYIARASILRGVQQFLTVLAEVGAGTLILIRHRSFALERRAKCSFALAGGDPSNVDRLPTALS